MISQNKIRYLLRVYSLLLLSLFEQLDIINLSYQNMEMQEQYDWESIINEGYDPFFKELSINHAWNRAQLGQIFDRVEWDTVESLNIRKILAFPDSFKLFGLYSWPFLQALKMPQNKLVFKDIRRFIKIQWDSLEYLDISHNEFGNEGVKLLLQTDFVNMLQDLNLSFNNLNYLCMNELNAAPWVSNLTQLDLSSNPIGKKGAERLNKINLTNLKSLKLRNTRLTSQAIRHLTKCHLPYLSSIDLISNIEGPETVTYLVCTNWYQIKSINIYRTRYYDSILGNPNPCMSLNLATANNKIWFLEQTMRNQSYTLLSQVESVLLNKFQVRKFTLY